MPYKYLDDIAIADVAFEAWGTTLEELFTAAAEATMNLMVADLATIASREKRKIELEDESLDLLLFNLLQELIFYKDAERLLLRMEKVQLKQIDGVFRLEAEACGEEIDPSKHQLGVDVKAITLHRFQVKKTPEGWQADVIVDV
ncbi:MAG: archease [Deltaproteobacteria bacterium]|nr:archease [Deltaproteobacteria bacterium]